MSVKIYRFILATIYVLFALFVLSPLSKTSAALNLPSKPTGFVSDSAHLLQTPEIQSLEQKLSQFEQTSSNEIAVVTISSLEGDVIENIAVEIFEKWGIGKKKKDNGVLIVIARDDRQMRIEVGYGLEGALTDAQSIWIINNIMKPAFQSGNFYQGIDGAIDKIIAATKGEYIPEESDRSQTSTTSGFPFQIIVFGFFIGLQFLSAILGKSRSFWQGGVLGAVAGFIIGLITYTLITAIIFAVGLGLFGLLFDFIVSRSRGGPGGGRFFGGFGGGSSGGFGGFGGGSSGGGGASGRW